MSVFAPQSRLARESYREVSELLDKSGAASVSIQDPQLGSISEDSSQYSHEHGQGLKSDSEGQDFGGSGDKDSAWSGIREEAGRGDIGGRRTGNAGSSDLHEEAKLRDVRESNSGNAGWSGFHAVIDVQDESQEEGGSGGSFAALAGLHAAAGKQDNGGGNAGQVQDRSHQAPDHGRPHRGGQHECSSGSPRSGRGGEVQKSGSARDSPEKGSSGGQLESFASALDYVLDHLQDLDTRPHTPKM
jgi:hypothetical protein